MSTNKVQTLCGKWHSRSNISKHRKTCLKCKRSDSKYEQLESENKTLRDKVAELEKERSSISTTVVNIGSINVLNIVPFSKEPTISKDEVKNILEPAEESVPKYVKLKHFTYGGGNLRIPNKNQQRIEVFCEDESGKNWVTKHKTDFIKELAAQSLSELMDLGADRLSREWKIWVNHIHHSNMLDVQIKNDEKLSQLVMYAILDNQR
jgi:hypothetical protein